MRDPNRTAIARQKRILPARLLPHLALLHLVEFLWTFNTAPVHYLSLELLETCHFIKSPTPKYLPPATHTLLGRANQLKLSCKSTIAAIDQTKTKQNKKHTQHNPNPRIPLEIVVRSTHEKKKIYSASHCVSHCHSRHSRHHHRSNKLPALSEKQQQQKSTNLIDFRHRDGVEISFEDLSHNYQSVIIIIIIFALVG